MPRRTSEIIDFREETDASIQSVIDAVEDQTLMVTSSVEEGNLTNKQILAGQERHVWDEDVEPDDVED